MCHSIRSVYDLSSICEHSSDKLSNYCEETFSTLSFSEQIPSTTWFNENLIEMPQKSSSPLFEVFQMDSILNVTEGEDSFPISPSLAQLSPGLDDLSFAKDWFLDSPTVTSKDFNLHLPGIIAEDLKEFLSPAGNSDSEGNFDLLLGLVGSGPAEVTASSKDCFQETAAWLTKATIAPDHLTLTGLTSGEFGETVVTDDKQVLQEIVIPSTVPDNIFCDTEVKLSKTEDQKVAKSSSSKSRKRLRQSVEPGTKEYVKKRELNNISVRKSRGKARQKQQETEERAEILSAENNRLQVRVDSLEKELTILRGLFANIGATLPAEIDDLLPAD